MHVSIKLFGLNRDLNVPQYYVVSASNRNKYQEYFLGVKAGGA